MSKYRAQPVVLDNIRFASQKEAARYMELKLLQRSGYVKNLETQVPFDIVVNGKKVCTYVADFQYVDVNGITRVEDVKGMKSGAAYQMFRLKKKLVEAVLNVRIDEV